MQRIEQAVILAAGEGQRLRPFTASKPKVMIPIANKPILRYVIEAVAQNGIRKIVDRGGLQKGPGYRLLRLRGTVRCRDRICGAKAAARHRPCPEAHERKG